MSPRLSFPAETHAAVEQTPAARPSPFPFPVRPAAEGWGLYIHVPFCARKCPYCDFNTYAGQEDLHRTYADALAAELRWVGEWLGRPRVRTVFIGGGTPTVLPPAALERIFTALYEGFRVDPQAEVSCEANPGTVDQARFQVLRELGVNRLSLGAQSFDAGVLRFLGRIHSTREIVQAVEGAQRVGFANINLDLIYGVPGQSLASWEQTLQEALALAPTHLSCYALTVEAGTPLARWVAEGRVPAPDDDVQAAHYERAREVLAEAGFRHYEISNWARPGHECAHNLIYWRNQPYLGFGPGAHACDLQRRWWVERSPRRYIQRVREGRSTVAGWETLAQTVAMAETMMLGLRLLREGVSREAFRSRFGVDPVSYYEKQVKRLQAAGLVEVLPERLRLTPRAYLVANRVMLEFFE